ncbi:MAG: hypothetical protein WCC84_06125 [Candidatus Cybelea sp.]
MESRTRRRLRSVLAGCALAAACGVGLARASAGPPEQTGIFALLGGTPKIVSKFWAEHGAGLAATLDIRQYALDGKTPILTYEVDMQKLAHIIIVRDDFATFAHLHPSFDSATGTFSLPFTKGPNHRYYVFADTTPRGIGHQVFRFTTESDGPVANSQLSRTGLERSASVGPYTVTLGTTTLAAGRPQSVDVTVLEGGRPASDLATYLGAAAHAVLINVQSLSYVHVHPSARGAAGSMNMTMSPGTEMDMSGSAGPLMQMNLPSLPAGSYRLWVEFRGAGGKVFTAPFTLLVR